MSKAYHTSIYFYFTAVMTVSFAQLLFVTLSWWLAPSRHLNCMWLVVCLSALALWWTGHLLPSTAGTDSSLMFTFTEVQLLENMIRPGVGAELQTVTSYLVRGVSGLISNDTLTPALPFLMHISSDRYQRLIDRSMCWH